MRCDAVVAAVFFSISPAAADCPDVMDATLPTGTIRRGNPGHPTLSDVKSQVDGDSFVIQGTMARPDGVYDPSTPNYRMCRVPGTRCAQFTGRLPDGHVVGSGGIGYEVREVGSSRWINLTKERPRLILRPDNSFLETDALSGEYEEYHGFSISPLFLTVNCAVNCRETISWKAELRRPNTLEFRISVPMTRCPGIVPSDDPAG